MKFMGILALFYSLHTFASELELPTCEMENKLVTPITFFAPESLREEYEDSAVKFVIEGMVSKSNEILDNSCIPIQRELKEIIYVSGFDTEIFQDIYAAGNYIDYYYEDKVSQIQHSHSEFYGLVVSTTYSDFELEYCGATDVSANDRFFVVDMHCPKMVLEHELGHLAWAMHDMDTLAEQGLSLYELDDVVPFYDRDKVKSYAFAYQCGGKGTVMSYAEEYIPVYSSPDIKHNGVVCGDPDFANNAKVLRDYALEKLGEKP
ncbi:hypothetical protein [Vibrio mediterranei]|uniref:hypothetical protein n=1 Tax=Vibrio mediterranei TaxID=689 RepID=UPI00148E0E12|nr:hypothetical protein [Vibrio mediterranei]NOI25526.1 hypothetical protein [Vibrio mediterranei]